MNGREAIKAMLDGKRVVSREGPPGAQCYFDGEEFRSTTHQSAIRTKTFMTHEWDLVEVPLTDEQLIAELKNYAAVHVALASDLTRGSHCRQHDAGRAEAFTEAADLLERRKLQAHDRLPSHT